MALPTKYIINKTSLFLIIFFGAISLNFFLPRLIPGNPAEDVYAEILKAGGSGINPSYLHQLEAEYGLSSAPIYVQYWEYLKDLFQGNLGV